MILNEKMWKPSTKINDEKWNPNKNKYKHNVINQKI